MKQREQPLTVIHFTGYDVDIGGVLNYVRAASQHNGARNILVVGQGFTQTRKLALRLMRVPSMKAESLYDPFTLVRCLWLSFYFHRLLRTHGHVIFHGHSRSGLLIALILNVLGHSRCLATVHANARQRWFYRWASTLMGERLTWLCPSMKSHYGLSDRSWRGCFPGVPLHGLSSRSRSTDTVLRLGGLGTLVRWKRWHLVLEALAFLPSELRERVRFTHIGATENSAASREYATFLKDETDRLGLQGCVEWRGRVGELTHFWDESDTLVICSDTEPWGLVMLEALFMGIPVIASASGGPLDVIRAGENGFLFKDGDASALASLLEEILNGTKVLPSVDADDLKRFSVEGFGAKWRLFYLKIAEST